MDTDSTTCSRERRTSTKRWLASIIVLLLVAACKKEAPPPNPTMRVNAQQVFGHDIEYVYEYPGVVQGVTDYPVIPRVSGAIFRQLYKEGTFVQKDQPLYEIDKRPFLFALKTFEGQYHKDKAARDNYKLIYDRYASLAEKDVASVQDMNTALINYQGAVGNVMTDLANIDNAKLNLEYCTVRAPASGYISERMVSPGLMVTAFQTQLNVINSQDAMYVAFSMPELDRLAIENGKIDGLYQVPADYRFDVDLELADGTRIANVGKVEFKDIRVSFSDGVWQLRATIDNSRLPRNKLLAGQFVHVYLRNLYVKKTYAVPQEAIFRDHESSYLFIKDGDHARKHRVKAGKWLMDGTQLVDNGLTDGMVVITNGGVRIADGDAVAVDELKSDRDPPDRQPASATQEEETR